MGQRVGHYLGLAALLYLGAGGLAPVSHAQTVILYSNDFEHPNKPLMADCGNSLDSREINELYGTASFQFVQDFTVEAVFLHDPKGLYNGAADHGDYAIGMLSKVQDDKLALAFDSQGYPFINLGLDLSSIDVQECGGPFGVTAPRLRVTLLDRPDGVIDYSQTVLDTQEIVGTAAPDAWTFQWTRGLLGLSTKGSRDGRITIVFDLIDSGYAVFDNLSITASMQSKVIDLDLDGKVDNQDNCPTKTNPDQSNADGDKSGDACDPAPSDPLICANDAGDCTGSAPTTDAGTLPAPAKDASTEPTPRSGREDASTPPDAAAYAGKSSAAEAASGCGCSVPGEHTRRERSAWWMWLPALCALARRRRGHTLPR
jgi:MYXO-CTERM domain-containing protein